MKDEKPPVRANSTRPFILPPSWPEATPSFILAFSSVPSDFFFRRQLACFVLQHHRNIVFYLIG